VGFAKKSWLVVPDCKVILAHFLDITLRHIVIKEVGMVSFFVVVEYGAKDRTHDFGIAW
jgi:hypothetical protein